MRETVINWLHQELGFFQDRAWIVEVFVVVLVTTILAFSLTLIYHRVYPRLRRSRTVWDDTVFYALHKPLHCFIWLIGLCLACDIVAMSGQHVAVFEYVAPIRSFGTIVLFTWFLLRFIGQVETNYIDGRIKAEKVDQTTVYALGKIFRAAVLITSALVALQTFGISITGILAFGGIGGAALAFASKDLLANYFGGLIVYLDRPFAVGDWIRSPDRNIEGVVEYIGWRLCRIRTFDKRPLYIPNTVFTSIAIENPSRMTNRRIYQNIGLRYKDADKVDVILQKIEDMLRHHPEIDTSQLLLVNLTEFASSSLTFMVYTFTKTTNWAKFQAVQQDVLLKIIDIILSCGAQCAFPTTTVHIPEPMNMQMTDMPKLNENYSAKPEQCSIS